MTRTPMTPEPHSTPTFAAPPSSLSDSTPDVRADPLPTHDALPPGTRLEEFEVERMIGASGFGIVYLGFDQAFERRVAVKEYLPVALASRDEEGAAVRLRAPDHAEAFERGRRAFVDESQLLARLDHPSLLHVLRSWEANGTAYRAMPYYAGHNLLALRQAMDQPPDEASLRALLDGLLGALEAIHRAGRVHREVTPSNIVLMPDDHPVLLDCGAARRAIVGEQTQALMTLLEPTFAPMEQIAPSSHLPQGPWTDLYAVAATVHYCVSGRLPAAPAGWLPEPHEPLVEAVQRLRKDFPQIHYSESFLAAIDAALAMRPRDRPQSVAQFRAALDERPAAARVEPAWVHEPTIGWADEPSANEPELAAAPMPMPMPMPKATPIPKPTPMPKPMPKPPPAQATARPPTPPPAPLEPDTLPPQLHVRSYRLARERQQRRTRWTTAGIVMLVLAALAWMFTEQHNLADAQTALADIVKDMSWTAPKPAPTGRPAAQRTAAAAPPVAAPAEPAPAASQAAPLQLPEAPTAAIGPGVPATVAAAPTATAAPTAVAPTAAAPVRAAPAARPTAAAVAPKPTAQRQRSSARATSPRQICAGRTEFALYRCMQKLCAQPQWSKNAQCKRLRVRDEVVEG